MRLALRPRAALALLLATALGVRPALAQRADAAARVDSLADALVAARLAIAPEMGTELGIAGAEHGRIADNSLAGVRAARARVDALRAVLATIDPATVAGRPQEVTLAVVREQLESEHAQRVCRYELWGVASYVNGWQAQYTDLALLQPVGTDTLRALALARARALPRFLDDEVAKLREGLRLGWSSPRIIVRNVIGQLDAILASPGERSPFWSPAARDSTPAFRAAYARVVDDEIHPAIRRYRDFLEREYLPKAREALGVSANPDGVACYRAAILGFTTVAVPPDSVFAMGLAEMARIEGEMRTIAARSFDGESLATLLPRLRTDPRYTFTSSQEIIDTSQAVIVRAKAAMGRWFGRLPRADVVIQPYPEFRQKAGAPGQYQDAPDDGSRPAIFLINPSDPTHKSRADAENTAIHEAIPGHHLQVAIAKERGDLHRLQRYTFNSGFGEGWALYAERLGDEMGLYSSDVGRMGMLASEAFRAARMVIDAGIHTKGWSRQQALDYLLGHTVLPAQVAEGEIDRYISWPGQAPSYMIGRNEILRLREAARARMGARFDIRAFHDQVLQDGTVPLAFLRQRIERWMTSAAPSAATGTASDATPQPRGSVQYRSPAGVTYYAFADTEQVARARAALAADPRSVEKIVALGTAQAGARQMREAVETFTRGLAMHPDHPLLLRWRGHRHLSVRDFDRANADLTRGARLDSTIYGIWYHLGVLRFVKGDFAGAADAFRRAQPRAPDPGELAGSTDWLWMSLMRAGRKAEAEAMLARRPDSLPTTVAYARRLALYRGEIGPEQVFTPGDTSGVNVATLSYGLGNWYLLRGDRAKAREWFERAIASGGWPAFGFIAAEAELRRLRR